MSTAENKAVFLSYASQDADSARRVCEALRGAGVEVWFDQSELRGGDAWDAKIRKQIKECALFVPVISANTQARLEGYFRLEWKLAAQRTHTMAEAKPFLLPLVIDDTRDAAAHVPEEFRAVQWTRLPGANAAQAFCRRVVTLLGSTREAGPAADPLAVDTAPARVGNPRGVARSRWPWFAAVALFVALSLGIWRPWGSGARNDTPNGRDGHSAVPSDSLAAAQLKPTAQKSMPVSEAGKLAQQAKALIDDDPLRVRENFLAAERLCHRATTLDPADSEAWAVYARASSILYFEYQDQTSQRREGARSRAETALRLASESIEAGLARAWYDYYVGGVSLRGPAIEQLEALAARAPMDRRILELRARIELRAAARDSAADSSFVWAQRAEAVPGGSPITLLERARLHANRNELPQMAQRIDESLRLQPTSLGYDWKLSLLVNWLDDLASARALLATLPASLREEDGIALKAFHVELWSRQFDQAVKVLSRVPRDFLEGDSIFYSKGYLLGEALHHGGKLRAAEIQRRSALRVVEQRIAAEPNSGRLLYWKAKLLARLGQLEDAEKCFKAADELGVEFARWSHIRAVEQPMLVGQHEAAIAAAERQVDVKRFRWNHPFNEIRFDPLFDPLRNDPRFQALIARGEAWMAELRAGAPGAATMMPPPPPAQKTK